MRGEISWAHKCSLFFHVECKGEKSGKYEDEEFWGWQSRLREAGGEVRESGMVTVTNTCYICTHERLQ